MTRSTEVRTLRDDIAEEATLRKAEVRVPGVRVRKTDDRRWYVGYARFAGNSVEAWALTRHAHEAGLFTDRQLRILRKALKEHDDYNVIARAPLAEIK